MKKICILSAVNIKHMSLISLYTEILDKNDIDYDIIYMDKYAKDETFPAKHKYRFVNVINPKLPKIIRGLKYFKFIGYAKQILKKNKYDFIIVWNDVAIFLFGYYLTKHCKGRYCLNVRDYFYQKNPLVFKLFDQAINSAAFTTISSPGYRAFLPKADYIDLHSLNLQVLQQCVPRTGKRREGEPIRITFIGNVRYFDINKRLLDIFKNDSRFELHYYGTNAEILQEYAKQNGIKNTVFGGTFPVKDTSKYIDRTDIINNLYGHGRPGVDYALSIKLYHGIYCNLPVLVEPRTYMETIVTELENGYVVRELSDNLNDLIFDWYTNFDFDRMSENCSQKIRQIVAENGNFTNTFERYLR